MSSTSEGIETWGFVASLLGTVFLVPQICIWLKNSTPSAKMRKLDVLLSETEGLLRSALAEGTISYSYYDRFFNRRLWSAKLRADQYRATVYSINGRWHECRLWMTGLSGRISDVIDTLSDIRAQIAATSSKGRQRLTSMGCTTNLTLVDYARREEVPNLVLPVLPTSMTSTIERIGTVEAPLQSKDCFDIDPESMTHFSMHAANDPTIYPHAAAHDGKLSHPQPLPPISAYIPTTASARSTTRVVLCRPEKADSCPKNAQVEHHKHHGVMGRFRAFTRLFRLATSPTTHISPRPNQNSNPLPLSPSSSEKSTHLRLAQREESDPVVVHVQLPA